MMQNRPKYARMILVVFVLMQAELPALGDPGWSRAPESKEPILTRVSLYQDEIIADGDEFDPETDPVKRRENRKARLRAKIESAKKVKFLSISLPFRDLAPGLTQGMLKEIRKLPNRIGNGSLHVTRPDHISAVLKAAKISQDAVIYIKWEGVAATSVIPVSSVARMSLGLGEDNGDTESKEASLYVQPRIELDSAPGVDLNGAAHLGYAIFGKVNPFKENSLNKIQWKPILSLGDQDGKAIRELTLSHYRGETRTDVIAGTVGVPPLGADGVKIGSHSFGDFEVLSASASWDSLGGSPRTVTGFGYFLKHKRKVAQRLYEGGVGHHEGERRPSWVYSGDILKGYDQVLIFDSTDAYHCERVVFVRNGVPFETVATSAECETSGC